MSITIVIFFASSFQMRSLTQVALLVCGKAEIQIMLFWNKEQGDLHYPAVVLYAKPSRGKENLGEENGMSWAEVLSRVWVSGEESWENS